MLPLFLVAALLLCGAFADDLNSVEHIVIWMQENRPFDFYYGTMKGVRGFSDRAAVKLPSGLPIYYQPINQKNFSEYMLPWHADPSTTSSICMSAPAMDYITDIRMCAWATPLEALLQAPSSLRSLTPSPPRSSP
jgi:phospholipase C